MAELFPFTAQEKAAAVRREVAMRERVYPGLVANHKMSAERAERGIAIMRAIAEDYEREAGR